MLILQNQTIIPIIKLWQKTTRHLLVLVAHFGFAKEILITLEILIEFLSDQSRVQSRILLWCHGIIPDLAFEQVFDHFLPLFFDFGLVVVFHVDVIISFFIIKLYWDESCKIVFDNIFQINYFLMIINALKRISLYRGSAWFWFAAGAATAEVVEIENINN